MHASARMTHMHESTTQPRTRAACTRAHACKHASKQASTHAHTHRHTHTRTQTQTRTRTCTRTHIRARARATQRTRAAQQAGSLAQDVAHHGADDAAEKPCKLGFCLADGLVGETSRDPLRRDRRPRAARPSKAADVQVRVCMYACVGRDSWLRFILLLHVMHRLPTSVGVACLTPFANAHSAPHPRRLPRSWTRSAQAC
jgi:hypothetical protein